MQAEHLWIDSNSKRVNINNPAIKHQPDINGVKHAGGLNKQQLEALGYQEITIQEMPDDYSDATYFRAEQESAPYVVYTQKSTDQLAKVRWAMIKTIRDELTENGGCFVAGKWFHSDMKSKQQQIALHLKNGGMPPGMMWKTFDGSFIEMTAELAAELFNAQLARENLIFSTAEIKKNDASDIYSGWPARYVPQE